MPAVRISVVDPWSSVVIVYAGRESRCSVALIMLSVENMRHTGGEALTSVNWESMARRVVSGKRRDLTAQDCTATSGQLFSRIGNVRDLCPPVERLVTSIPEQNVSPNVQGQKQMALHSRD